MSKLLKTGTFVFVIAAFGFFVAHYLYSFATGTRFTVNQWGAAGAWASAVGATALALASVWLAVQANGQARKAEQRAEEEAALTAQRHQDEIEAAEKHLQVQLDAAEAQNDRDAQAAEERHRERLDAEKTRYEADIARIEKESRDRQREEIRKREYDSAQAILVALGKFVADVFNHDRVIETSNGITDDLRTLKTLSESDRTSYSVQMTIRTETSQMALLGTANDCLMTVRTAMFQVTSHELASAGSSVFKKMQEATKCFTTPGEDNDWKEAIRKTQEANEAGLILQREAAYRFLPTDDQIPSELPVEYAIQSERRPSEPSDSALPATHSPSEATLP